MAMICYANVILMAKMKHTYENVFVLLEKLYLKSYSVQYA
jgi:hypothetical protein